MWIAHLLVVVIAVRIPVNIPVSKVFLKVGCRMMAMNINVSIKSNFIPKMAGTMLCKTKPIASKSEVVIMF